MITKIDSDIYRGKDLAVEQSSFIAVNPNRRPGGFVFGGAIAGRESLSGQIACRLALESYGEAVLDYFSDDHERASSETFTVEMLEAAFKLSNDSVYQFGHSMAAGGKMGASLVGLVVHRNMSAAGRVGNSGVYLVRGGETFPYFETGPRNVANDIPKLPSGLVGMNSLIQVELASIKVQSGDVLVVSSHELSGEQEAALADFFSEYDFDNGKPAHDLCSFVFPEFNAAHFLLTMRLGAESIYLSEVVG